MDSETLKSIQELDEEILHFPDNFELYYRRGLLYFVSGNEESAQADYIKAVSLGLDCTQVPYYPYAVDTNAPADYSKRDRIILILFVILFAVLLAWDSLSLILEIKHRFFG